MKEIDNYKKKSFCIGFIYFLKDCFIYDGDHMMEKDNDKKTSYCNLFHWILYRYMPVVSKWVSSCLTQETYIFIHLFI